ncbi:MAG: UDP-N-acetylglucosamine 1-carboxyvinyltransferase [Coriobacteriia bacterium]|nr:UDP-N-acetylglucosamine 1-carboxyvinyltransferase [Coriobacteriia bacterium]
MESIIVCGGRRLSGEVAVEGAKNSALKLMAASLMVDGVTRLTNVPEISDVDIMAEVLVRLGASVERSDHALQIDATTLTSHEAPYELVAMMRASTAVLGPLLARLGLARVALPGGCNIGSRKIDMHMHGLEALGVVMELAHGYISASVPETGLQGAHTILDFPSVGATENLLMAAVTASGTTIIENAAREPEIGDLADFLVSMGARITGIGSSVLTVEGVDVLSPVEHRVVGDRIEAGTFLVAGAMTGGPVTVTGFDPAHLEIVLRKLVECGCDLDVGVDRVTVSRTGPVRSVEVQTLPFPGFPTDMQAQFMAMLTVAQGGAIITENVFENRFMCAGELGRMGADIRIEGHHALVKGVDELSGAPVKSTDLRGGAALVLAGLIAQGETVVTEIEHIDRGYERFCDKLAALGANIMRRSDVTDFDGAC